MSIENAIPEQLKPPAGLRLILRVHARGDQIYVCKAEGAGFSWMLQAPEAEVFDEGRPIGRHFAGPTWELNDGSRVTGKILTRAESPDIHAIPWLLISAVDHSGEGLLNGVTHIQRLNTTGGKAPEKCRDEGRELRVGYTADYIFYGE